MKFTKKCFPLVVGKMDELDLWGSIQFKLNLIGFARKVQFVLGGVNVQSHFHAGHLQEANKKSRKQTTTRRIAKTT